MLGVILSPLGSSLHGGFRAKMIHFWIAGAASQRSPSKIPPLPWEVLGGGFLKLDPTHGARVHPYLP